LWHFFRHYEQVTSILPPYKTQKAPISFHVFEKWSKKADFLNLNLTNYLAILHVNSLSNSINLLVHFGTMVISLLTSARNSEGDATGMPRANTGDLSQTFVGLARQFLRVPPGRDTWKKQKKCQSFKNHIRSSVRARSICFTVSLSFSIKDFSRKAAWFYRQDNQINARHAFHHIVLKKFSKSMLLARCEADGRASATIWGQWGRG